jgi:hypothetical protein
VFGDQAHQGRGFMGIELVDDKNPEIVGLSLDNVADVIGKIRLGASWTDWRV